jgi:DNA-3-methyladenine glycosylase
MGKNLAGPRRLGRAELPEDTVTLARFLLGKLVVHRLAEGVVSGRVVETEAYPVGDPALHAFRGMTPRNRSLFRAHGHAYVYICYGRSMMLNISSEAEGVGAGVLFRAVEPVEGVELMIRARGTERLRDLARGPGRLGAALRIDRGLDGADLCAGGPLYLADDGTGPPAIGVSTRIGLSVAAERRLRFYVPGSLFVSGTRRFNTSGLAH